MKNKFPASKTSQTSKLKQNKLEDTLNTKDSEDSDLFTEIRFHKWNLYPLRHPKKVTYYDAIGGQTFRDAPQAWVLPSDI